MPKPIVSTAQLGERLEQYIQLLVDWRGLVAEPDPALVEDSLVLVDLIRRRARVVDVGSGGGLPGIPLKLARPDLEVTLMEANHRKAAFLTHAAATLRLERVHVVAKRAEDAGHDAALREHFDVAVVRALAHMSVLLELCLPLVKVGGRLLAMKTGAQPEVDAAGEALDILGGRVAEIKAAPSAARTRGRVVVVEKVAATPPEYPRRAGVPARRPLGM